MENQDGYTEYTVEEYGFRYHKKYFEQLKASLDPFGIYLESVLSTNNAFTVYSNSPIVWEKKALKGKSARNFLYLGEEKMKLYNWLAFTHEAREKLLKSLKLIN